jgi:hypothetical protein
VVGFILARMKPMCKILNMGHVFVLLPDNHHFAFRRRLFTRFQELSSSGALFWPPRVSSSFGFQPNCPVCKSNLTVLRRILHLDLAKGNAK